MKKLFIYAAALLAFCGCDKNEDPAPSPVPDAVSVAPASATVSSKGGSAEAVVTSSGEWTLTGDYDWVTPSVTTGKDGTIVKFTVAANDTEVDKIADFTFTVGKKTAPFKLTSKKKGASGGSDEIIITPESEEVLAAGGSVEVIVTSSGEWTLTGNYSWATPSATTGEDGDVVTFTVAPNTTNADLMANFVFTVGTAEVPFKLVSKGVEKALLTLLSPVSEDVATAGGQIEVLLNSNVNYRELTQTLSAEAEGWLTYSVTLIGSGDASAKMYFNVVENPTFESRMAKITISAGDGVDVVVTVNQKPKSRIEILETLLFVPMEGGNLDIPITANVEYDIAISTGAESWITPTGKADGQERFTVAASDVSREGTITFTEKGGAISVVVKIIQKTDALINIAADLSANWAWPAWNDPTPVNNMATFTFEALVNAKDFKLSNRISTIMGIEGTFLIRLGDVGSPQNQIQVVYNKKDNWGALVEAKLTNANMKLASTNKWYHIAVTYGNGYVKAYIDGVEVGTNADATLIPISFGVPHNEEQAPIGKPITRCFWVGYAYEGARDFRGMMSEIRIWNKVLTPEEINAENHFYKVDPAAEGLVTYWKFNDGKGGTVRDHTTFGNDLTAKGPLTWNAVTVPE